MAIDTSLLENSPLRAGVCSKQEATLPLDASGELSAATEDILAQQYAMAEAFPNLAARAVTLILQPEYAYGNEFEFGLDMILDGLKAAHDAEGTDD